MRALIWIVVLFAVAVGLVLGVQYYSGNVYIIDDKTQTLVRINLSLFVGAVLLLVIILNQLLNLLFGTLHFPHRARTFFEHRREHKGMQALNRAGLAYFEGRFQQAEAEARKVLDNKHSAQNQSLALILAAYSADQMDNAAARDRYLQDIARLPEKQQLSRHLLLAETALSKHDYPAAQAALQAAAAISPTLTRLVKLQLRCAVDQNQPEAVLKYADKLYQGEAISAAEVQQYQVWAYREWLYQANDLKTLKTCLKQIPGDIRDTAMSVPIAEKYTELGLYPQTVKWVRKHYPHTHDAALLPSLIQASQYLSDKAQQQSIDLAESWLKERPNDAQLLLYLGQMAFDKQLWGKARSYLEASLGLQECTQTRLILAKVLDKAGEFGQAEAMRAQVLAEISADNE